MRVHRTSRFNGNGGMSISLLSMPGSDGKTELGELVQDIEAFYRPRIPSIQTFYPEPESKTELALYRTNSDGAYQGIGSVRIQLKGGFTLRDHQPDVDYATADPNRYGHTFWLFFRPRDFMVQKQVNGVLRSVSMNHLNPRVRDAYFKRVEQEAQRYRQVA